MVVEIELADYDEYMEIDNILEGDELLNKLRETYPEIWTEVLKVMQKYCDDSARMDGYGIREYSEEELREIFWGVDDWVDHFEDIYFKEDGSEKEILLNYYVCDSCGTDRGTQHLITANGYVLVEGGL